MIFIHKHNQSSLEIKDFFWIYSNPIIWYERSLSGNSGRCVTKAWRLSEEGFQQTPKSQFQKQPTFFSPASNFSVKKLCVFSLFFLNFQPNQKSKKTGTNRTVNWCLRALLIFLLVSDFDPVDFLFMRSELRSCVEEGGRNERGNKPTIDWWSIRIGLATRTRNHMSVN